MRKLLLYFTLAVAAFCCIAPASAQSAPARQTATPVPAKMQFFLKLIPPRPTFAMDMTPDEQAVMTKHAAYWAEQFKTGKVLIIGPVLDPKGAWGMAVLETDSIADAQKMANDDPSVQSGLNKVELSPMSVFLRKKN